MDQPLRPSRARLKEILEATNAFLGYLDEAALIDGAKAPPIPSATVPYRRSQVIYRWHEWERKLNPSDSPWNSLPDVASGGWREWRVLHFALVDLEALRKQLITRWNLEPIIGSKSVRLSMEASQQTGYAATIIYGEMNDSPQSSRDGVRAEMVENWPPLLPLDWRKQCQYVQQRISDVIEAELGSAPAFEPGANADDNSIQRWDEGIFLAKARELSRRLKSWHIEDYLSPIQFTSQREARRWERLTFREIIENISSKPTARPGKGLQFFMHPEGEDESGYVGEVYENPDRDTDRSLTLWLMGDFFRHLEATAPSAALNYLKESYYQLLDLPSWTLRGPKPNEPWPTPQPDKRGEARSVMVTGRQVPPEFLQNLTEAAEKLLAATPVSMQDRLHVDDIDNFNLVRGCRPADVAQFLKEGRLEISEDAIKKALEEILDVPFHHRDSPNELDDIYTANVSIQGVRRATAFILKGPGLRKKELTIAACGKNGDQLVRLFDAPADLFVVQFIGRISEMVIKDIQGKIEARYGRGMPAQYMIIDGQDTARLLFAYGKLSDYLTG
jgi:hypothetical protein